MNIKDYLKSQFIKPPFEDVNILGVLAKRSIPEDAELEDVSIKNQELAYADLLMILITMFSGGGETKKRGNWSETSQRVEVGITDRRNFRTTANAIYEKYGEEVIKTYGVKNITNKW